MDVLFWLRDGRSWIISLNNLSILPSPSVRTAPGAPPWLVGACAHAGRAVPVIDLALLTRPGQSLPVKGAALLELSSGPLAFAMDEWQAARIPQVPMGRDWKELVPNSSGLYIFPERLVPYLTSLLV